MGRTIRLAVLAFAACGAHTDKDSAVDPIVAVWDDPLTGFGSEFRADGTFVTLGEQEIDGRWVRTSSGRYEIRFPPVSEDDDSSVVEAHLEEDLLRVRFKRAACFRRRVWTPEEPGPRGSEAVGKFVVHANPRTGSREYLQMDDGSGFILRRLANWTFVDLDGTRLPSARHKINFRLGHRYRIRGERFTLGEYGTELQRLGRGVTELTYPPKCLGIIEVHEWVQLEPSGTETKPAPQKD